MSEPAMLDHSGDSDGICSFFGIPARREWTGCNVCGHPECAVSRGETD